MHCAKTVCTTFTVYIVYTVNTAYTASEQKGYRGKKGSGYTLDCYDYRSAYDAINGNHKSKKTGIQSNMKNTK